MFTEGLGQQNSSVIAQRPNIGSFLPNGHHPYIVPSWRDVNPQGYFCYKENMTQHMESSVSRSRSKAEAKSCLCLSRPLGECHRLRATAILVTHGWLYQGATSQSSWSEEHSNLMFPIMLCMEFAPFVMLRWLLILPKFLCTLIFYLEPK